MEKGYGKGREGSTQIFVHGPEFLVTPLRGPPRCSVCVCAVQTVIELKSADKHDTVQWYTLYHQQDDTVTASSSITSAASLEVQRTVRPSAPAVFALYINLYSPTIR